MPGDNGNDYLKKIAKSRVKKTGTPGSRYSTSTVTQGPGSGSRTYRPEFTPMNTQGWQNQSKKAKRSGSSAGFYATRKARGQG